jgi:hypothetical protein
MGATPPGMQGPPLTVGAALNILDSQGYPVRNDNTSSFA